MDINNEIEEIKKVFEEYRHSFLAGSVEQFCAIWHDDGGMQIHPDAPPSVGMDQLRAMVESSLERFTFEIFDITLFETKMLGSGVGFGDGEFRYRLIEKSTGKPIETSGRFMTIVKKDSQGEWKILRDCYNYNPNP